MPSNDGAIFLSSTDYDLPANIGQGLAKYAGFREMARGGNALLRSCYDQVVGRTVALKTMLPQFQGDRRESRRFLREARITAQLQHPNTVPVYEIGRDPAEGLYFTMKRISGENFFEILKRIARNDQPTLDAYPIDRRVEIVADASQALDYAHARGVIHRDVKPENIWVGNFGEVILLDWGVAKVWGQADDSPAPAEAAQQQAEQKQQLTLAGQRPGTPLYMSPEQVGVNRARVDERSDIFSVGVVLYEMLTFSEPFRGRVVQETFENIIHLDPPPPSQKAPGRDIPAELDRIVMRAIAKSPGDRYQEMRQLIADLRRAAAP